MDWLKVGKSGEGCCCRSGNGPSGYAKTCGIYRLAEDLLVSQAVLFHGVVCCRNVELFVIWFYRRSAVKGRYKAHVATLSEGSWSSQSEVASLNWNTLGGAQSLVIRCQLLSYSRNSPLSSQRPATGPDAPNLHPHNITRTFPYHHPSMYHYPSLYHHPSLITTFPYHHPSLYHDPSLYHHPSLYHYLPVSPSVTVSLPSPFTIRHCITTFPYHHPSLYHSNTIEMHHCAYSWVSCCTAQLYHSSSLCI
jgi:hypothetical protein